MTKQQRTHHSVAGRRVRRFRALPCSPHGHDGISGVRFTNLDRPLSPVMSFFGLPEAVFQILFDDVLPGANSRAFKKLAMAFLRLSLLRENQPEIIEVASAIAGV